MRQTCQSGVEVLMDYLEDALAPDVRAAVEGHVQGCPRCRAFIESYRLTPRIMREATVATLPPDLARSLHEVLRRRMDADSR